MEATFPLRLSRWALPFLLPLSPHRPTVEVTPDTVEIRMGLLGSASVPLRLVDRIGAMDWPWWGGVGARLGKGLVAFVAAPGEVAVLELTHPIPVRAPLRWMTRRVVVGPDDLHGFSRAVARARNALESW
jgi:hypothetical protein